jgi:hypothetical protein
MGGPRHFFVGDDGSNYEIYVQDGFIHIKGTSFEDGQHGQRTIEEIKGTELTITYEIVEGQAQEADLEMQAEDTFPSQRYEYHIPAKWPACMVSPGQEHRQLPSLQAFFQRNVDNSMLSETSVRSRNTIAKVQHHSYTYSLLVNPHQSLTQHDRWADLGDAQQYVSEQVNLNRIARLRNERSLTFIYLQ